jgi:SAM-dependent methyltransferase
MTCPACLSANVELAERVDVTALAESWVRAGAHGPNATPEAIYSYVLDDVGATVVQMMACAECEMEFADPRRTWRPTHYPAEGHGLGWDHEQALALLSTMPRRPVLDIGCADGQFLERAAALGHQPTGVDFSEEDVDAARHRGVEAFVGDLSRDGDLMREQRRFATITMFQVIEHLEQLETVFTQIGRLAAPEATLMIGCPSPHRYTRTWEHPERIGLSDYWDYPPQHSLRWSADALRAFLTRHGWHVTSIVHEPLSWVGAAAHLTALSGRRAAWYSSPLWRRLKTASWLGRIAIRQMSAPASGIRLFASAVRVQA